MKISAFHIKNYRSIIDSGTCYLSPDYITALIGQNESGKTSVLEALRSFYEGVITDDVLRSDLTFPNITCTFSLDENHELGDYLDMVRLPVELHTVISTKKEVSIRRAWHNAKSSTISIAEHEIIELYNELENKNISASKRIIASIPELLRQTEAAARELENSEKQASVARSDITVIHNRFEELKKMLNKAKNPSDRITTEQEMERAQNELSGAEATLKESLSDLEQKKSTMQHLADKLSNCKAFSDLSANIEELSKDLIVVRSQVRDTEHEYEFCRSDKQIRAISKRLEIQRERQGHLQNELKRLTAVLSIKRKIGEKMLDGKKFKDAESDAVHECEVETGYATPEELGMSVFKHIPMFEFFEDFGSLLPNKIDLDDLLNENIHAEGYKAARNFLSVAGLNADFFREKNHRILKQKIENLNTEITIDFQDYWRQSVGKDDKIRINFELEHYDNAQPEKSGKPYLEFWVKDKQERLYPKQRSRGVRWFLSFYLELKATAKSNSEDRVMLIDEPGLSLHARAQEDVLKVFEDLRDNLQIIYCTHSPNLIDLRKLYRVIAVQRARDTDEKSETIVLDARRLNAASADTLSPIYSLMGTRMNDRQFIFPKNNLIVEDSITFHYLEAMAKLSELTGTVYFIPSSGADNVSQITNILFGWKVDFSVLLMDNPVHLKIMDDLKSTTFYPDSAKSGHRVIIARGFTAIEDLFSTIDFKRFVLQQRVGITVSNSEYIEMNKLSRVILVSDFCTKVQKEGIAFIDFDEETQGNFEKLFTLIKDLHVQE
jgi:predicted ATP-dependent endonuclease of OLD family